MYMKFAHICKQTNQKIFFGNPLAAGSGQLFICAIKLFRWHRQLSKNWLQLLKCSLQLIICMPQLVKSIGQLLICKTI